MDLGYSDSEQRHILYVSNMPLEHRVALEKIEGMIRGLESNAAYSSPALLSQSSSSNLSSSVVKPANISCGSSSSFYPQEKSKQFAIGNSDFRSTVEQGGLIIDKSLFIKEIIDDKAQVKLIIRPRRFGKTFNMSMLRWFFDQQVKDQGHLFHNLKIWQAGEDYRNQQGKYPVISITFSSIRAENFKESYEEFQELLSDLYAQHKSFLSKDVLEKDEDIKKSYQAIIDCKASKAATKKALKKLTEYLYKAFKKRVILLIDEYDTPINYSYSNGYYSQMMNFIRALLSHVLKDNAAHLEWALLTGILRIAKESIFSGLNNVVVHTPLGEAYSTHFGFLLEEIQDSLGDDRFNKELMEQIEEWYGGYQIGNNRIFNPWSIANFIGAMQKQIFKDNFAQYLNKFEEYWTNTSDDKIIKKLIEQVGTFVKAEFKELIENKSVTKMINDHTVFADIDNDQNTSPQSLWSFLLLQGYLTFVPNPQLIGESNKYELIIPNRELYGFYEKFIRQWFYNEEINFTFLSRRSFSELANPREKQDDLRLTTEVNTTPHGSQHTNQNLLSENPARLNLTFPLGQNEENIVKQTITGDEVIVHQKIYDGSHEENKDNRQSQDRRERALTHGGFEEVLVHGNYSNPNLQGNLQSPALLWQSSSKKEANNASALTPKESESKLTHKF